MTANFQHTYREGHSTSTALTQITDDWLRKIDKKIAGAVLLDFSATFDIIDHSLLLEKHMCYGFTPPAILWIKSYLSNIDRGCSLCSIINNVEIKQVEVTKLLGVTLD